MLVPLSRRSANSAHNFTHMQLHELKSKTRFKDEKRIGRGGKRGKTSGKGGKGQTARAGGRPRPELRDMIKRLPKRRGFGKNRSRTVNNEKVLPYVINVGVLSTMFNDGDSVSSKTIVGTGFARVKDGTAPIFKILGVGEMTKKLNLKGCLVSESARAKIEAAGGTITK